MMAHQRQVYIWQLITITTIHGYAIFVNPIEFCCEDSVISQVLLEVDNNPRMYRSIPVPLKPL
jgi:hypothetical protein